jgi:hypothetical protein
MSINSELKALYSGKWEKLTKELDIVLSNDNMSIKPTNPLLISLKDENEWINSDIRLMFFGQETNDWYNSFNGDIDLIISKYLEDYLSGYFQKTYRGAFWNGITRFEDLLKGKYPSHSISMIWNNIIKIGKSGDKGAPPSYIYEIEKQHFFVINEEIEILKPNLLVFFTGPYYDPEIQLNFGQIEYQAINQFNINQLAQINIPNVPNAFRTYHPGYLWRKGIDKYLSAIIDELDF